MATPSPLLIMVAKNKLFCITGNTGRIPVPHLLLAGCQFHNYKSIIMIDNRNSRNDWQQFSPENIPCKSSILQLEQFLDTVSRQLPKTQPIKLLDLGCGNGAISKQLYEKGFSVIGIDINTNAIEAAQKSLAVADEENSHELKFFQEILPRRRDC